MPEPYRCAACVAADLFNCPHQTAEQADESMALDDLWEAYDAHVKCEPSSRRSALFQGKWLARLLDLRDGIGAYYLAHPTVT